MNTTIVRNSQQRCETCRRTLSPGSYQSYVANGKQCTHGKAKKVKKPLCVHLGKMNGQTLPCSTPKCGGRLNVPLHHCAVLNVCTILNKVADVPCCVGCEKYEPKPKEIAP